MNNYKIYNFENILKQIIIDSGLPPSVIYYILDKMTIEIRDLYFQCVQKEAEQQEQLKEKIGEGLSEKINETFRTPEGPAGQE